MYIWTDTAPATIVNLDNCVSIEADEGNNELWAIGNDGERYFLHRFNPEDDEDPRQAINAIRAIYEYLEEGRQAIDMSDIERELRPTPSIDRGQTKRRPPKRLRVTMGDGTVIDRGVQLQTFIEAIETAGIERVHALGLGTEMHPLVERKNTDDPPGKDRSADTSGFYSIYVAYPAEEKEAHLNTISEELDLQWTVKVSDGRDTEDDYENEPIIIGE